MRRLLIVLAVLVACMAPNAAYAQDVSLVDSFTSGVGTWGGGQDEMDSNSSVQGIENGGLLAAPAESVEDASTLSYIQGWVSSLKLRYGNAGNSGPEKWYTFASYLFVQVVLPVAVLLVFFWWGLRKALRVLMASFRKGKANV